MCHFDFFDQSRRCSSESNANHQFYLGSIYKTEVVLENIFFRISSFIYELRRVLRRRLYAGGDFPIRGADGPRGSSESGTAPKP